MKWSGVAGGAAALVGTATHLGLPSRADELASVDGDVVWSSCMVNCGARCPLRLVVKDGTTVRVLPDNAGGDEIGMHRIPACPRGRSIRVRVYNPDRLKKPMKRVPGTKRGDGQWEEISWDQALTEIAEKYKSLIDEYGPESQHLSYGTGVVSGNITQSYFSGGALVRLLNMLGGFLGYYGDYSTGGITEAMRVCLGGYIDSNSSDDVVNSKLYVLWGHSPLETKMSGGSEGFYLPRVLKEAGVRTYVIDPRQSDSENLIADEWLSPRPGTDAILVAGIAYVLLQDGTDEQEFLDQYCVGFDEDHLPEGAPAGSSYRSYIEGDGPDRIAKTPQWASDVTGVPESKFIQFAHDLGANKPSMIHQGWGPQRHANGEYTAWSIMMLNAMLGNVGLEGGGTGTFTGGSPLAMAYPFDSTFSNSVTKKISHFTWLDAIEDYESMGPSEGVRDWDEDGNPIDDARLEVPVKAIWCYGSNMVINQHAEINNTRRVLEDDSKCELIVVIDNHMTASAQMADYVLPGTSNTEETDVVGQGLAANMGYTIVNSQAINPLYEARGIYDICSELADKLGVLDEFTEGKTQEDWVMETLEASRELNPEMPEPSELKDMGVWKKTNPSRIALQEFREDPEANPLSTPSGLIEIYSQEVHDKSESWTLLEGDRLASIPEYVSTWEDHNEARTNDTYPLQMIGFHFKGRTHSSYGSVAILKEAHTQVVLINPADARARGIENGDKVEVFNERGRIRIEARVTPRILPHVVSVPEGAWYSSDDDGTDTGGCPNTLTRYRPSALAKTNPQYTNLVQVQRIES